MAGDAGHGSIQTFLASVLRGSHADGPKPSKEDSVQEDDWSSDAIVPTKDSIANLHSTLHDTTSAAMAPTDLSGSTCPCTLGDDAMKASRGEISWDAFRQALETRITSAESKNMTGDTSIVDEIDSTPWAGWSALMYACGEDGEADSALALLSHGANPNFTNRMGWTPLLRACWNPSQEASVVRRLLERRADVNHLNNHGQSCLMGACRRRHEQVVEILLNHVGSQGSQSLLASFVNRANAKGQTALMVGCRFGMVGIVTLLLRSGADALAVDDDGRNVARYAKESSKEMLGVIEEHVASSSSSLAPKSSLPIAPPPPGSFARKPAVRLPSAEVPLRVQRKRLKHERYLLKLRRLNESAGMSAGGTAAAVSSVATTAAAAVDAPISTPASAGDHTTSGAHKCPVVLWTVEPFNYAHFLIRAGTPAGRILRA